MVTRANSLLLKFWTVQTILIGIYHFYIPYQFNWSDYLEQTSPTINWSLFSLNNYFSFNLLVLAIFMGYYLFKKQDSKEIIRVFTSIILIFWVFSTAYHLIEPLPEHLKWIGLVLVGVAIVNVLFFLIPLFSLFKKK